MKQLISIVIFLSHTKGMHIGVHHTLNVQHVVVGYVYTLHYTTIFTQKCTGTRHIFKEEIGGHSRMPMKLTRDSHFMST